jgi:hypothetical protein
MVTARRGARETGILFSDQRGVFRDRAGNASVIAYAHGFASAADRHCFLQ